MNLKLFLSLRNNRPIKRAKPTIFGIATMLVWQRFSQRITVTYRKPIAILWVGLKSIFWGPCIFVWILYSVLTTASAKWPVYKKSENTSQSRRISFMWVEPREKPLNNPIFCSFENFLKTSNLAQNGLKCWYATSKTRHGAILPKRGTHASQGVKHFPLGTLMSNKKWYG